MAVTSSWPHDASGSSTLWLHRSSARLSSADSPRGWRKQVAKKIPNKEAKILVMCSDGMDRAIQVCALAPPHKRAVGFGPWTNPRGLRGEVQASWQTVVEPSASLRSATSSRERSESRASRRFPWLRHSECPR